MSGNMENYTASNTAIYLIQYHIIWTPKYRRCILVDELKNRLQQIIEEVCYENALIVKALEIMPDHIHLFIGASPKMAPYKIVKALKGRTSHILREEFKELLKMPTLWSGSYFISTIGNVSAKTIQQYIEKQWKK